jgi:hypothetical protein
MTRPAGREREMAGTVGDGSPAAGGACAPAGEGAGQPRTAAEEGGGGLRTAAVGGGKVESM